MESYLRQVHNLTDDPKFSKLGPETRRAIMSSFIHSHGNLNELETAIIKESSLKVLEHAERFIDIKEQHRNIVFTTYGKSFINDIDLNNLHAIIDFKKANNIQNVNGLFIAVNDLLPDGGVYIGRLETYGNRKEKMYKKYGRIIGRFFWSFDFVINRIIPRIPYLEKLYYNLTNGKFHSISKSEAMGRLVYCGFEIIDVRVIRGLTYFVAVKIKEPSTIPNPSYYPIIRLQRIGKDGKLIGVYKFRTMHPYSEYLQDYFVKRHGYNDKGKPANDFRVTRWGIFMRKLWLDEMPQLINVLKGEMKLVGIRPLSKVRFDVFPEDLKKERIKLKPGCFPPYVALIMPDSIQNIEAERIYINDLSRHPHFTDIRYLWKSVINILFNKIRSS